MPKTRSQLGRMSREKGKRGELEWAGLCRAAGFSGARRGQQYKGGADSPDVVDDLGELDQFRFECRMREHLHLISAMKTCRAEKRDDQMPVVCWKKNREDWYVIMRGEDWLRLMRNMIPKAGLAEAVS